MKPLPLGKQNDNRTIKNPIVGDELTFITLASESAGKRSIIEVQLKPGGSSEPHFHKTIVETFKSLSGSLSLIIDGVEVQLKAGESHTVQPGAAHQYFNSTDSDIRFRVEVSPGHVGFEQFLQIIYGLAQDRLTTKSGMPLNPLHTGVLLAMSDTNLPGFIRIIEPVIKIFGFIGRRIGTDQKLIQTYCKVSSSPQN